MKPNIRIADVSLTPNPVSTGKAFVISVTIEDQIFAIVNSSGKAIKNSSGKAISTKKG